MPSLSSNERARNKPTVAAPARLSAPGQWRTLVILAVILALAAALRGLYLAELVHSPTFGDPAVDGQYHDYWARSLATGNWTPPAGYMDPLIRATPFLRPPGYPYFLSLIYRLTGPNYMAVALVQMGMGIASCFIGFLLARRWFDDAVGLLFAALMGAYWLFIYYEGELLEPGLLVFLFLLLVYALGTWTERMTLRRGLIAGVLLGLAALTRPNILLFGGPIVLWAFWVARRRGNWRGSVRAVAGLGAGAVLTVAPVTIRNYVVARDFVLISANSGVNLWIGNNDRANGAFVDAPRIENFDTCFSYPAIVRSVERRVGRPMRYSDVSAFFARQTLDWVRANPWLELKLLGFKTLLFWGPVEVHHNTVEAAERANSAVLRSTVLSFPIAFSLFVLGIAMFFVDVRRGRVKAEAMDTRMGPRVEVVVLILLFPATYFVSFLPFFVVAQYRAPVIPFLLLMAAYAVVRFALLVRAAEFRQLLTWGAAAAVVIALASRDFAGHKVDFAKWHYDRGDSYLKRGKVDDAIREYGEAVRASERYPQAHAALAVALADKGDFLRAAQACRGALELQPDNPSVYLSVGLAYDKMRRTDEAIQAYQMAIRHAPDYVEAYVNLGAALQVRGRLDEAIRAYEAAIRIAPNAGFAHFNLAIVLYRKGRYAEAWQAVRQAHRCGEELPASFIKALSNKMPAPG